jgi:short-subunit dehydrogenase involved in D-alanine esterification of teichoic acids
VVLNSGIQRTLDFTHPESIDMAHVETELTTNYLSYIGLLAAFLPQLQSRGPASPAAVVVVTSGLGLVPIPRPANYCATKAALHSLCWTMRAQLAHDERSRHVRVVELIPPAVQTELHPLQPDLAAKGQTAFGMPLDAYIDGAWAGLLRGEDEVAVGDVAVNGLAADAKRREIFAHITALMDNPNAPYTVRGK